MIHVVVWNNDPIITTWYLQAYILPNRTIRPFIVTVNFHDEFWIIIKEMYSKIFSKELSSQID